MEIDTQTHHPNPQPQPHQRKIELQSSLDLIYLQQNLAKTALAKLDLHFPPIPAPPKPATIISLDGGPSQNHNPNAAKPPAEAETQPQTTPEEIEPDPLRTKVQSLLSDFLLQTWQTAQSNLTLNGLEVTTHPIPPTATLKPPPHLDFSTKTKTTTATEEKNLPPSPTIETEGLTFQYTPFDPRLQTKLATLHSELEKLTSKVSQLRRTAPHQGAQQYTSILSSVLETEESTHTEKVENLKSEHDPGMELHGLKVRKEWNEDVREIYGVGVEKLDSLAGMNRKREEDQGDGDEDRKGKRKRGPSLTETMGKVQRARTVALEME